MLRPEDFGQNLSEDVVKKGLLSLNPNLQFDPASRLGLWHPEIDSRQGVFLNDKHITSMGRGVLPEFNVWAVVTDTQTGKKRKSHIIRIGWRHTFSRMIERRVPNVNWQNLRKLFNIEWKEFVGDPLEDLRNN